MESCNFCTHYFSYCCRFTSFLSTKREFWPKLMVPHGVFFLVLRRQTFFAAIKNLDKQAKVFSFAQLVQTLKGEDATPLVFSSWPIFALMFFG